ncbi:hypothetical protein V6N12_030543 [Hibiscus sabdariffa]|uniref:Uncharacterized protein n=1 Tax=Hibiscus sabdariffa TaxID=183260 RepID=A0ABR2BC58_9ROSI
MFKVVIEFEKKYISLDPPQFLQLQHQYIHPVECLLSLGLAKLLLLTRDIHQLFGVHERVVYDLSSTCKEWFENSLAILQPKEFIDFVVLIWNRRNLQVHEGKTTPWLIIMHANKLQLCYKHRHERPSLKEFNGENLIETLSKLILMAVQNPFPSHLMQLLLKLMLVMKLCF